jgi:hypothetical protein
MNAPGGDCVRWRTEDDRNKLRTRLGALKTQAELAATDPALRRQLTAELDHMLEELVGLKPPSPLRA